MLVGVLRLEERGLQPSAATDVGEMHCFSQSLHQGMDRCF
jgi:hypothetical protein